jgi:hypothetical protein
MVVSSVPSRDCGKISYPHAGVVEAMQSTRLAGGGVQYQAIFMPSGKSLTLAKQDVVEGPGTAYNVLLPCVNYATDGSASGRRR